MFTNVEHKNGTPIRRQLYKLEHLGSAMEKHNQVQWSRDKVQELRSKGYSQREISQILQIGLATVNGDISY